MLFIPGRDYYVIENFMKARGRRKNAFIVRLSVISRVDGPFAIRHFRSEKEMEPKCVPQLFRGSLLGTRRSAIGQFFSVSLVTVPEVFAKVNSPQFLSHFSSCRHYSY